MLSIKHIPSNKYAEESQPLKMRWCVLDVSDTDNVVGQHGWWQCKDFLNDCVFYLATGTEFSVYRFPNKLKLNNGLSYIALKDAKACFIPNYLKLNEWLISKGLPRLFRLKEHDGGCGVQHIIKIPAFYWSNTFLISFITSLLRSCGYKEFSGTIEDIHEMFLNEPTLQNGYFAKAVSLLEKVDKAEMDKLVFKNYAYDATNYQDAYYVHNAGLQKWVNCYASE